MSEASDTDSRDLTVLNHRTGEVAELSTDDIVSRLAKIEDVQRRAMTPNVDYGRIPGTGNKPTLLKAGAEKLCVLFRLDAQFQTERTMEGGHLTAVTTCIIYHQVSAQRLGSATAMCSSRESKYAWRKGQRLCPTCHKDTIMKPKAKEGRPQTWWCNTYREGCGANFGLEDPKITGQSIGRVPNEDVADQFPTVLRMAEKRALVAAVRLVTGASAIFDEDAPDHEHVEPDRNEKIDTGDANPPPPEDDDTALQDGFDAENPPPEEVPHALGPAPQSMRSEIVKLANQVHGSKSAEWLTGLKKRGGKGLLDLTAIEAEAMIDGLKRESMRQGAGR